MIPQLEACGSASAGLTDNLRTFVVKFSHDWLPIGVRERRCSGDWTYVRCVKSRPFLICTAASPEHSGETGF
jgi:hypothetical protein